MGSNFINDTGTSIGLYSDVARETLIVCVQCSGVLCLCWGPQGCSAVFMGLIQPACRVRLLWKVSMMALNWMILIFLNTCTILSGQSLFLGWQSVSRCLPLSRGAFTLRAAAIDHFGHRLFHRVFQQFIEESDKITSPGMRMPNSCQADALIQSASRMSPRPRLILSINNPADSSLFFSNKEMDYTACLKANNLPSLPLPLPDSHWPPNEWMRAICHRCPR